MKNYLLLILLCGIAILFIPLAMVKGDVAAERSTTEATISAPTEKTNKSLDKAETISVFRTVNNKTVEMDITEYVCGSVAAEMPLAYNNEAIKAQAVACYTNALRLKSSSQNESDEGDISDNTAVHQGYIDKSQRKEKWGEDFEKYEKKLQNAVKEVKNEAIYYNDKLCVAAFSAISNGKTEDARYLWGSDVPYLKSVDSKGDKLSPGYASTLSYSKKDFLKIAEKEGVKTNDINSLKNTIKIAETSPAGTVLKCEINGKNFTGEEIRKMFSLRSPTFTVKATDSTVTFSVTGYGHGIGLSQYGSNYLAQKGYTYKEILEHYYTGAEVKLINN